MLPGYGVEELAVCVCTMILADSPLDGVYQVQGGAVGVDVMTMSVPCRDVVPLDVKYCSALAGRYAALQVPFATSC